MCLVSMTALAIEIVFDPAADQGDFSGTQARAYSINKEGVTIAVSNGMIAQYKDVMAYRVYKAQTMTVTSTIGNITGIEIYSQVRNDTTWGAGGFVANVGTYEAPVGQSVGYWSGNHPQVVFTAQYYQVRVTKIRVIVGDAGDAGVSPPRITPAGGTYYEPIEVNITCGAEGAKIYYTTDGNDPTTSSKEFTAPFMLNTSATVKAIAARDGEVSNVVIASYVFEDRPMYGFGNLADVPDNTEVTMSYDATVIWQGGNGNNYLYACDETGFGLIYGAIGRAYSMGDIIPAGFKGKKTTYKDEPELTSSQNFKPATAYVQLTPEEITPLDVNHEHWAHYVLLRGVYISVDGQTLTDRDGHSCEMYNGTFNVELPSDLSRPHDVYAVVGKFNNYQVLPLSFGTSFDFGFGDVHPPYNPDERLTFTYDATVLLQLGNTLYAKDPTGYAMIYGNTGQTYQQGDIVPSFFSCTVSEYAGQISLTNPEGFGPSKGHTDVVPEQAFLEELEGLWCHLVAVGPVTITPNDSYPGSSGMLSDGRGNSCPYNDPLHILAGAEINPMAAYGIEGIVVSYRDHFEILITRVDGLEPPAVPDVATLAELYALPRDQKAHFTTPLVAVYQKNDVLYVQDSEGRFGKVQGELAGNFVNGNIINGAVCSWSSRYGSRMLNPDVTTFVKSSSGPRVEPDTMFIEEISSEMDHCYVRFNDVTIEPVAGYSIGNYIISDDTDSIRFVLTQRLPHGEPIRRPSEGTGEINVSDVNILIGILLGRYPSWDGKYDVTGFVKYNSNSGVSFEPVEISCVGHGYDLMAWDINDDGELTIADLNALIDLILNY